MPKKPIVFMCVLDVPQMQGICGNSRGDKAVSGIIQALERNDSLSECPADTATLKQGQLCRTPIANLDKATAFLPKEWEKVKNYQDELKRWGEDHCSP